MKFIYVLFFLLYLGSQKSFSQSYKITDGKVSRGDFNLHYTIVGNTGPYILLLSGGPGSSIDFMKPVADSLSSLGRCILLEQRGTGRSVLHKTDTATVNMRAYVEDIEALRLHLSAKQFILIGESWGSLLSFLYAGTYPQQVSGIISLTTGLITSYYADVFDDNKRRKLLPGENEIRDVWRQRIREASAVNDTSTVSVGNYIRDVIAMPAYYYNRQLALKAATYIKTNDFNYKVASVFHQSHPKFDIRHLLKNITCPVLLMQGRQDLAGEANVYETHLLIKNSILKFFERCGHFPLEEKPAEAWPVVKEFFKKISLP
jgi:proline-specific peptidase